MSTVIEQIAAEVEQFGANVKELRQAHERQIAKLQKQVDDIEAKGNRARLGIGGRIEEKRDYEALSKFVRSGDDRELKAMSVGSDPDGGYVVHPTWSSVMTKKLYDHSPLRRLSRVETIASGDAWEEPVDADDIEAAWVGEVEARPETQTAQIGVLRVPVHEIYANQPVTQRLLDDANIDIGAWVEGKIGDKFARQEGEAFLTGNGVKRPRGLLTYPTSADADSVRPWGTLQYVNSGAAETITADALIDLAYAVRAPYRQGAAWLMSSDTARAVAKLKDGNGDYLWKDSFAAGQPPTLLGYPVEFDENMPAVAAGAFPVAFGNWPLGYLIVDKKGIKWLRDPFTSKPNVLIYAYARVGGGLANSEAIKLLRISA